MRSNLALLTLALGVIPACGAPAPARPAAPCPAAAPAPHAGLQVGLATIYVDDQDRALRFYTEVLGLTKKDDVVNGGYRWLTVTAADHPDGGQLQLALDVDPAARAFQEALFAQGQPAAMLFTADLAGDYQRIQARGGEFMVPPTDVTFATIAMVKDTVGNLVQLTELHR